MMMAARSVARIGGMALIALLLVACGDDDDGAEGPSFDGVYRVASHTRSHDDCEKEGASSSESDTFFKLSQEDGKLNYQACDSAQACSDADRNRQFESQIGSEWVGVRVSATTLRDACNALLTERIASRINGGDNIQIEVRQYRGQFESAEDEECSDALVVSNRDALGCYQRDIIRATPVAQP